jgi:hypothetical protein
MVTAKQRTKTTGTRKPATGVAIPKGIVEQATLTLQDLPEKPKDSLSLKETIESMYDAIKAALAKGYSQEDVASFLSEKGVDISPASLKYYLSRLGRARSTGSTKPRKVRRTKSKTADASTNGSQDQATAAPKRRGSRTTTQTTAGTTTKRAAAKSKSTAAETPVADTSTETKAPASKRGSRSSSQTKSKAPAKSKASTASSPAPKPSTRQRKKA